MKKLHVRTSNFLSILVLFLTVALSMSTVHAGPFTNFYPISGMVSDPFQYNGALASPPWSNIIQQCSNGTFGYLCNNLTVQNPSSHPSVDGGGFLIENNNSCLNVVPPDYSRCTNAEAEGTLTMAPPQALNFSDSASKAILQERIKVAPTGFSLSCDYLNFAPKVAHTFLVLKGSDGSMIELVIYQQPISGSGCPYRYSAQFEYVTSNGGFVQNAFGAVKSIVQYDFLTLALIVGPGNQATASVYDETTAAGTASVTVNDSKIAASRGIILTAKISFWADNNSAIDYVKLRAASTAEFKWDWADYNNDGKVDIVDGSNMAFFYDSACSGGATGPCYWDYWREGKVTVLDSSQFATFMETTWPTSPYPGIGYATYKMDQKWANLCGVLATSVDQTYCNFITAP